MAPGPCPFLSNAALLPSFGISASSEPRPGLGQVSQRRQDPQVPGLRELPLGFLLWGGTRPTSCSAGLEGETEARKETSTCSGSNGWKLARQN